MTGCEGQDWASYQSSTPSTAGLGFAIIKATEGTNYVSPVHAAQVAHARAEGVVVGHYHFARPGSMAAQVSYFLQHAAAKAGDILCLDWEDAGVTGANKDAWLKAAQKAAPHNRVILYCNKSFWKTRDTTSFAADGLWIADPDSAKGEPDIEAPWLFHQYSEAGGIDRDYSHLTAAQLHAWANQEVDVPLTAADVKVLASTDNVFTAPTDAADYKTNKYWTLASHVQDQTQRIRDTQKTVNAMAATIHTLAGLAGAEVDTAAVVTAVQQAIAAAVVHVDVDVTGNQS